ncbi:MAG: Rpn family recombination-promoting nuclease/putative transposase [Oscillospiraceae bacterium]|nr:Rpn family recombination-promoting nuclease/putative transposase [Oscillospiraceae bacterium]
MSNSKPLLPVKSDFVFKLIFGDQKNVDILADFLKSVLDIPDEEYDRLTVVDPHVKKEFKDDKYGIFDVKIHTRSGNVIQVEIQVEPIPDMIPRIIYGQSKMVTEQIKSGQDWGVINKVVSIIILDYDFVKGTEQYHHKFRNRTEDGIEFTDLTEINTLELSKLPSDTDSSALWNWMKFIKSDDGEVLDMIAERNPQIRKAVGVLKELSADERTRMLFDEREKARRDVASRMAGARRDGHIDVAKNLVKMGMTIDSIIQATGLSKEEIKSLQNT